MGILYYYLIYFAITRDKYLQKVNICVLVVFHYSLPPLCKGGGSRSETEGLFVR